MDCNNTPVGEKNEPPQRDAISKNTLVCGALGFFQIIAGLFLKSSAFVADGINIMIELPFKMKKKRATAGYILCFVFLAVSLWIAASSFFDTAAVLDYFTDCVSIWAIPVSFLTVIVKVVIRMMKKETGEDTSKNTFDIFCSVLIALSVVLTYTVDFYFEPVVAIALATYTFTYLVERFRLIGAETKSMKITEISEEMN